MAKQTDAGEILTIFHIAFTFVCDKEKLPNDIKTFSSLMNSLLLRKSTPQQKSLVDKCTDIIDKPENYSRTDLTSAWSALRYDESWLNTFKHTSEKILSHFGSNWILMTQGSKFMKYIKVDATQPIRDIFANPNVVDRKYLIKNLSPDVMNPADLALVRPTQVSSVIARFKKLIKLDYVGILESYNNIKSENYVTLTRELFSDDIMYFVSLKKIGSSAKLRVVSPPEKLRSDLLPDAFSVFIQGYLSTPKKDKSGYIDDNIEIKSSDITTNKQVEIKWKYTNSPYTNVIDLMGGRGYDSRAGDSVARGGGISYTRVPFIMRKYDIDYKYERWSNILLESTENDEVREIINRNDAQFHNSTALWKTITSVVGEQETKDILITSLGKMYPSLTNKLGGLDIPRLVDILSNVEAADVIVDDHQKYDTTHKSRLLTVYGATAKRGSPIFNKDGIEESFSAETKSQTGQRLKAWFNMIPYIIIN